MKLRLLPSSLAATLYPALGERSIKGQDNSGQLQRLYEGSVRYLLLLTLPCVLFLIALGPDLLALWMGRDFARDTSLILQIMGAGFLLNSLANVPYCTLQALGYPNVTGKLHLMELPLYVVLCLVLIPHFGIVGAALANTARLAVDAVLLFAAVRMYCYSTLTLPFTRTFSRILIIGAFLGAALQAIHVGVGPIWVRMVLALLAISFYFLAVWLGVLDANEKPRIYEALKLLLGTASAMKRVEGGMR